MTEKQLERIEFKGKNKFLVDGKFVVETSKKNNKNSFKLYESEKKSKEFDSEDLLFDYIEEMTSTGSVGGGMELPLSKPKNKGAFMRRTFSPYNTVVEQVEKLVKYALIKEFVENHPAYDLIKQYQAINNKNSTENFDNVEKGIQIVYAQILPSTQRRYYTDNGDYNGDGIPNHSKENATNLDLQYDGASQQFKDAVTAELAKTALGQQMMQVATAKATQKDANPANNQMIQLGGDVEFKPQQEEKDGKKKGDEEKKTQLEKGGFVGSLGFAPLKEGQHFKFTFKNKDFTDRRQLFESIPAKVKKEGVLFEMLDGEGNLLKILWENNSALILDNKNLIQEQREKDRLDKLFNYKTSNAKKSKENEADYFKSALKGMKTFVTKKQLIKESHSDEDIKKKVDDLNSKKLTGKEVDSALEMFNVWLEGYGIEVERDHDFRPYWGETKLLYVNMGDSYVKTIIYNVDEEEFYYTSLGDYLE